MTVEPHPCKLFAVVVVHNISVTDSATIRNLLSFDIPQLTVIVADNSTSDYDNERQCSNRGIHYMPMSGNKGLSRAYNKALDYIQDRASDEDVIIWFDDDTDITEEYFTTLRDSVMRRRDSDVFVPIIYGQDGKIYSPNNAGFLKNKLLKSINDEIDYSRFNAINSCLAVRQRVYRNYRYNEDLFLASIDQDLFDDLRRGPTKFSILRIPVKHNFFQREKYLDTIKMAERLKIRAIDLMIYSRKSVKFTFLALIKASGWGVVFSWKCRAVLPLKVCIEYSAFGFLKNLKYFLGRGNSVK